MIPSNLPLQNCISLSTINENEEPNLITLGIPLYDGRPYKFITPSNLMRLHTHIVETNINGDEGCSTDYIKVLDIGDITSTSYKQLEVDLSTIYNSLTKKLGYKKFIFIGGDHTITYFTLKTLYDVNSLIVLDAHLDLKESYLHRRFNHATFIRRLLEETDINVYYIGVRGYDEEEADFLRKEDRAKIIDDPQKLKEEEFGKVYISIDLDVLDPTIIKQVEYPEPNGLSLKELLNILRLISSETEIVGGDIVEYLPTRIDRSELAAILRIYQYLAYLMVKENIGR